MGIRTTMADKAWRSTQNWGFYQGLVLVFMITVVSQKAAEIPWLSPFGPMLLAIILGIGWRNGMGVVAEIQPGIDFAARELLRVGIILMGVRLNLEQIWAYGPYPLLTALAVVGVSVPLIYWLGKKMGVPANLSLLIGGGTAVCGAAAIAAIAPLIKAKEEEVALSISIIALLGTAATMVFLLAAPFLSPHPVLYGAWMGGSLQEIAHVVAGATFFGSLTLQTALIYKLTRVLAIVPLSLGIMAWEAKRNGEENKGANSPPVPWFILGFLALSLSATLYPLPENWIGNITDTSVFCLSMAMVGLGLKVDISRLGRGVSRGILLAFIGALVVIALAGGLVVTGA